MYLQLAEGGQRRKGKVAVSGYKRKSSVSSHQRRYPLNENGSLDNPYIFIPNNSGGGVYVREDKFDAMPDHQWAVFMKNIAPFQPEVQSKSLSEPMFLASRASRKQKREDRHQAKMEKKAAKTQKKVDRTERKNQRRASKDESRANRDERKANRKGVDMDKVKSIGGALLNKFLPGAMPDDEPETGGGAGGESSATPFYKNPIVIGGAIVLTAGAIYLATRPKPQPAF